MPTTTENGWTDEFPQAEEAFYWIRHKQNHADINVGLLRDRTLLLAEGVSMSKSLRKDFEFLPASPSDFEQLAALREAAKDADEALQLIQGFDFALDSSAHGQEIRKRAITAIVALREALGDSK